MNEKKAKLLRRSVLFQVGHVPTKYDDEIVKQTKVETNRLEVNGSFVLNKKGEKEFFLRPSITRTLAKCTRSTYQQAKKVEVKK